jgi:hypothetical protein
LKVDQKGSFNGVGDISMACAYINDVVRRIKGEGFVGFFRARVLGRFDAPNVVVAVAGGAPFAIVNLR